MKIWGEIPRVNEIYNKNRTVNRVGSTSAVTGKKDVVSISNTAKDFQTVMKALRETPDVRKDKVDELSQKYESGKYDLSGKDIADRIIGSAFNRKI